MAFAQISTGNNKVDEALNNLYIILNKQEARINQLEKEAAYYKGIAEKKFTIINDKLGIETVANKQFCI